MVFKNDFSFFFLLLFLLWVNYMVVITPKYFFKSETSTVVIFAKVLSLLPG